MNEITCPQCATVAVSADPSAPVAENFCKECDFPLFWDQLLVSTLRGGDDTDASLRRLPGVAGRDGRAMVACPECAEPNPVGGVECIRCHALLDPPPPPPPPPEPEEVWYEPEPLPDPGPDLLFIALIIIALIMVVGMIAYGIDIAVN